MTTTLQDLKPSQIKPNKANPPGRTADVAELAASITAKGILEPLIVAPNGTGTTFVLLAGHRRLAAAKLAKLKTVPCIVREDLTDPAEQLEAMLVENLQRTDLTPIEEAEAYQQLLEFPGYTQKRITEATGRAIATVRARLKLAKLPKSARDKLHAGQISLTDAAVLVDFAGDADAVKTLERTVGTRDFEYTVGRLKEARNRERRADKTRRELEQANVRMLDKAPGWNTCKRLYGDEIDSHRECEGFSAYIDNWGGASYFCDRPDLHEDEDDGHGSKPDPAIAERNRKLADAAVARRDHLAALARRADKNIAVEIMRERVAKTIKQASWLTAALGITNPTPTNINLYLGESGLPELVVLFDLIENGSSERSLESSQGWPSEYSDYTAKWRARVGGLYAYEWSDFELELIAAGEKARVDRTAAADPDDDGEFYEADDDGVESVIDVNLPDDDIAADGDQPS